MGGLIDLVRDDKGNMTINLNIEKVNNFILGASTARTGIEQINSSIRVIYEYNPDVAHLLESAASIEEIKHQVATLTSLLEAYYKGNRRKPIIEKIKTCLEWIKIIIETGKCVAPIVKMLYNAVAQEMGIPLLP